MQICKFQLVVGGQCVQESQFINPPLGVSSKLTSPNHKGGDLKEVKGRQYNDQSYLCQFPIQFKRVYLKEGQSLQLKLIQLTKNGRQKQVGYSRMIINHEVIGKNTKHKIVKIGFDERTGEIFSIIDIGVQVQQQQQQLSSKPAKGKLSGNTNRDSNSKLYLANPNMINKQPNTTMKIQPHSKSNNNNNNSINSQQQSQQQSSSIDQNAKFDFNDDSYYSRDDGNNQSEFKNYNHNGQKNSSFGGGGNNQLPKSNDYLLTANNAMRNNVGKSNVQYYETKSKANDNIASRHHQNTKDSKVGKQLLAQINKVSPGKIYKQQVNEETGLNNNKHHQPKSMMGQQQSTSGNQYNKIPPYERREKIEPQQMDIMHNRNHPFQQNQLNNHSRRYLRLEQNPIQSNPNRKPQQIENPNRKTIDSSSQQQPLLEQKYNKTKRRLKYILNNNEFKNNDKMPDKLNRSRTEQVQSYNGANSRDQTRSPVIKIEDDSYKDDSYRGKQVRANDGKEGSQRLFHNTRQRFHTKAPKEKGISSNMIPTRQSPIANFRMLTGPVISPHSQHKNSQHNSQLPQQQRPALQYFITNHNPQDCYILNNLYIVYETSLKNKQQDTFFKPKCITFLTYNLYERILRINCLSREISIKKGRVKYLDAQKASHFILKSQSGQIKPSAVCDMFSQLQIYLPKHCLIFRLEVIMQDESIFIGTLANQIGTNIKSTLHLKKSLHQTITVNSQQSLLLDSINFIVDVGDKNSQQKEINNRLGDVSYQRQQDEMRMKYNNISGERSNNSMRGDDNQLQHIKSQHQNNVNNIQSEKQKLTLIPPKRKPYKVSTIESLPSVNPNTTYSTSLKTQGQLTHFDSTLREGNRSPSLSTTTVQKTLNAITAYKISLSPHTGPLHEMNNHDSSRVSMKYKSGQNYHVNFDFFNQQHLKRRSHIRVQQQYPTSNSIQQSDRSNLKQQGFSGIRQKQTTTSKDLPKIVAHKLDHKQKNSKIYSFKDVKGDATMNARKNKSISSDSFSSKNQIRLEFLKKVLGHKIVSDQHKNSSIQSIKQKQQKSHRKSKQFIADNQNSRFKKLKTLPNQSFNQTKAFVYDPKSRYQYHNKLSMSPNKMSPHHTYLRELKCLKNHMPTISSLSKSREEGSNKLPSTYHISIRKIEFLKLLDKSNDQLKKKWRDDESDNENQQIQTHGDQFFTDNEGSFEIFLKLFNESKRKKQLITPSKGLKRTFSESPLYNDESYHQQQPQQNLDYLSCSWYFEEGQFLFKKLTIDDLITIQAYGDLASIDNHEFLGKCILSVQEILYMQHQRRITGYLVKQKKTESHLTVYFEIEENKQLKI